jgi:integrase
MALLTINKGRNMKNNLGLISEEIRNQFPNLSDFEVAQLALTKVEFNKVTGKTVEELINETRAIYWNEELNRIRAKKKSDGSMNIKDTTTYRSYDTFWRRFEANFGSLDISEIKKSHVIEIATAAQGHAMADRTARNKRRIAKGLPKKEHNGARTYNACLDAISAVMRKAVDDELIQVNPVSAIKRKRYTRSERHGLSQAQMEQIFESALNGGNDPILDYLILWTLTETACRTGGLIKLQLGDISKERQTITLYEKGGTKREQPVTAELMNSLLEFAKLRGAKKSHDSVFRYLPNKNGVGSPLTARRFDYLWSRIGKEIPWVAQKGVTCHWIRHTTLTWIDRAFNQSVARAYAGHSAGNVTDGYTTSTQTEIMKAHSTITGRPHPLAV